MNVLCCYRAHASLLIIQTQAAGVAECAREWRSSAAAEEVANGADDAHHPVLEPAAGGAPRLRRDRPAGARGIHANARKACKCELARPHQCACTLA
eukprot:794127-Pleurochrysis_carterae.AAC.1